MTLSPAVQFSSPPIDEFDWPDSLDHCVPADTLHFASWLRSIDERTEITWRRLKTLYLEYCCVHSRKPLRDRQLQCALKSCGVHSYRPPAKLKNDQQHRPTYYRVLTGKFEPSVIGLEINLDNR